MRIIKLQFRFGLWRFVYVLAVEADERNILVTCSMDLFTVP